MLQRPPEPDDLPEPPALRRLRLVTMGLMLSLIAGVVVVAAALVISLGRFEPAGEGSGPATAAASLSVPEGETVTAVGEGPGVLLLHTRDAAGRERLRRYGRKSGRLLSETAIRRDGP